MRTPEDAAWTQMKQRCYNPNCQIYKYYGARGITVCERWLNSKAVFLQDMGPKPDKSYSLDRIDNDGNYEPSNCKWSSKTEQLLNRRPYGEVLIKGVSRAKGIGKWRAKKYINGKSTDIGIFNSIEEAEMAINNYGKI